ncbi:hypothetical protein HORIV_22690 [Vreelandella olivaria]|uniref:PIN-like protein n=1 Tax=Vreelandella olivaria TaxID=390919 RepID=A0ABM7GH43_9GAMM|nr:hypothetical protein HORIV_22690 [Halomonas olivaria]
MNLLELFARTLDVTLPVFAMVFVGLGLKRLKWIDSAFVSTASALVFRATLPTLIFLSLIKADLSVALDVSLMVFLARQRSASFCSVGHGRTTEWPARIAVFTFKARFAVIVV